MIKRVFDFVVAVVGLLFAIPLCAGIVMAIALEGNRQVFFRQVRVGRFGHSFRILKFRTMIVGASEVGPSITVDADARVTRVGRFLRRWKLDEIPQLWNVILGEMSLVGPRPEVPEFVALYPPDLRAQILSIRPGITDNASVQFRHENEFLRGALDPRETYVKTILPLKLELYVDYVQKRSFWGDLRILLRTAKRVILAG